MCTTTTAGGLAEMTDDLMHGEARTAKTPLPPLLTNAPLCRATTRAGKSCRSPSVRGRRVCRMHGGKSPGGKPGKANGNYRHGGETLEAVDLRREVSRLLQKLGASALEES